MGRRLEDELVGVVACENRCQRAGMADALEVAAFEGAVAFRSVEEFGEVRSGGIEEFGEAAFRSVNELINRML